MARKGRRSTNEERLEAIRLLQQGYTRVEVANILNVAESSVYDWQDKFRKGGLAALSTKIASGRKRMLTDKQLLQLYKWLRGNPRQVQFDFGLWTRKIVRDLIRREFGIDYSLQNVGKILKMLGFSPQRPVYHALERDLERRRIWMEETFPAIKERAEREGAKIFFADEAGWSAPDCWTGRGTRVRGWHAVLRAEPGASVRAAGAGASCGHPHRVLRFHEPSVPPRPVGQLEILRLVATGLSNAEIAQQPVLSPCTVDHVSVILQKLGVPTRREAAARAAELADKPAPRGVI